MPTRRTPARPSGPPPGPTDWSHRLVARRPHPPEPWLGLRKVGRAATPGGGMAEFCQLTTPDGPLSESSRAPEGGSVAPERPMRLRNPANSPHQADRYRSQAGPPEDGASSPAGEAVADAEPCQLTTPGGPLSEPCRSPPRVSRIEIPLTGAPYRCPEISAAGAWPGLRDVASGRTGRGIRDRADRAHRVDRLGAVPPGRTRCPLLESRDRPHRGRTSSGANRPVTPGGRSGKPVAPPLLLLRPSACRRGPGTPPTPCGRSPRPAS